MRGNSSSIIREKVPQLQCHLGDKIESCSTSQVNGQTDVPQQNLLGSVDQEGAQPEPPQNSVLKPQLSQPSQKDNMVIGAESHWEVQQDPTPPVQL